MKRVINGTSKEINGAAVEKVAEWDSKSVSGFSIKRRTGKLRVLLGNMKLPKKVTSSVVRSPADPPDVLGCAAAAFRSAPPFIGGAALGAL